MNGVTPSCFAFCRELFRRVESGIRRRASLQFTASVTRLLTAGGTSLLAMHRYAPICRLSTRWNCSTEPLYVSCFSKLPPPAHRENPSLCMFSSKIPSYPLIPSFLPIVFLPFLLDSFPPFWLERLAERDWQMGLMTSARITFLMFLKKFCSVLRWILFFCFGFIFKNFVCFEISYML